MKYFSVCSGIEAASAAWKPLGWEAVAFSEIEKFPCAVLEYHYPDVPNVGDLTKIQGADYRGAVDILVGGTPCQDFSVAGLRAGLDGERGNLTFEYIRLLNEMRPSWFVWENVPGVLSIDSGRAFGRILRCMAECGYGIAYRVLDAQYFGVPQRRRRVFVVGYIGDWRPAAAVLFERTSMSGNPPPSRKAGEGVAGTIKGGSGERGYPDPSDGNGGGLVEVTCYENHGNDSRITEFGDVSPHITARAGTGGGNLPLIAGAVSTAPGRRQRCDSSDNLITATSQSGGRGGVPSSRGENLIADPLTANWHKSNGAKAGNNAGMINPIIGNMTVRRLTPRECEALQGFPRNYTRIPWRGKPVEDCPDGVRYRALGNSMAVPVMAWIGERIQIVTLIIEQHQ